MLLLRFKSTITSGITDREEKDYILDLVVSKGELALPPIQAYLEHEDEIRFPLIALSRLASPETCVGVVVGILEKIGIPGVRTIPKTLQLLQFLEEFTDRRIAERAVLLLEDADDDIRVAAATVLGQQNEDEQARIALLEALVNEEESIRLQNAIMEVLAQNQWHVKGYRKKVEAIAPDSYLVDRRGRVKRRGVTS